MFASVNRIFLYKLSIKFDDCYSYNLHNYFPKWKRIAKMEAALLRDERTDFVSTNAMTG